MNKEVRVGVDASARSLDVALGRGKASRQGLAFENKAEGHQKLDKRPIQRYLPKRKNLAHVTQADCNRIAAKLNTRPRKRYGFETPEERFHAA